MLKRIQKIINIAKFADCRVPGCEFKKETIILGFNTQGKSTLTAILRSIQTGNNDILIGRKTFGSTGPEEIEIDFEHVGTNDKYVFQNRTWNKTNPNILIFDSKFIAKNIFAGESITFDQQRSLNEIIIGERGQELNKEISELQKLSADYANQKSEKTRELSRHFPGYGYEKFKSLTKDRSIDNKIKDKDKEIKFEQEKENIKKAIRSHIQSISGIRFSIRDTLVKTFDVKQKEIEEHIKTHFSKGENAENFLRDGLGFIKERPKDGSPRVCVFCSQELGADAEELVSIYSKFFKGGYEQLQNEINNAIDYFKSVNIEAILGKISTDLGVKDLDIGFDDAKTVELAGFKKKFEKELNKKRDLNYMVNFNSFDQLKVGVERIRADLKELEQKKLYIPSPKTLAQLGKERKKLEIIKKRFEPTWVKFCSDWDTMEADAKEVRTTREEKRKELKAHSLGIFSMHKKKINVFCKEMGADFEIEDFKPLKKIVGRDERIFAINFFGSHKVRIDNENDATPNFHNTLSDSDKRLLAFAFFISLLSNDRGLDKKIVVFDDPISSFDNERRRKTVQLITDVVCKHREPNGSERVLSPKQKIILTHEDRFAKELSRLMPNVCTLKIEDYMDGSEKRSRIAHADFSKEFPEDDISHRIEKIKKIIDTRSFNTPFEEDARVVLEHIFKRKYYLELKNVIARRKGVRTFIDTLAQGGVGGFDSDDKQRKFKRLCDDLNIKLHDGSIRNSRGDKESIINDFFECLKLV